MFEFDKYEKRLHGAAPAVPQVSYIPVANVAEVSLLVWGEHCVECAAPACFETCDLYQKRPDQRCRRFTFGVYKNRNFPSLRGYGADVSFKKWAKIEARGNTAMAAVGPVLRRERLIEAGAPIVNAFGSVINKLTGDIRWSYLTHALLERLGRRLHRRNGQRSKPDAFLLEVYNPNPETVRMQLSFTLSREARLQRTALVQVTPSFVTTIAIPGGYSRHEFERRQFQAVTDSGLAFDIALTPEADTSARLVFLTADFVRYCTKRSSGKQPTDIKCVVWDLDNTLWDGILVEGDDVVVRPNVVQLLDYFDKRGVLLSIASKNDKATVWHKLTQFGIADYFLYPQVNWMPKSQNIKAIAETLSIGLDTFAFVDDNPFERDEVSRNLPEVTCVDAAQIGALRTNPRFQGSATAEARNRRRLYREAITRERAQAELGENYMEFLASCGITLEIGGYHPDDLERVAELVQRTNQLNFSGRKYSRDQLNAILENPGLQKYVLKCFDNYGSYGTVGFSIVEPRQGIILIHDFMLSCRVQGKFLEQAFFSHLVEHHGSRTSSLWVNFQKTARNQPAQNVLQSLRKAEPIQGEPAGGVLLDPAGSLRCEFIHVRCSAGEHTGTPDQ